jgi:hypothetical protein
VKCLWPLLQHKAELLVHNYCMSDLGLVTYAEPQKHEGGYQEGTIDISELFTNQHLVETSLEGLNLPMEPMATKLEVRCCGRAGRWCNGDDPTHSCTVYSLQSMLSTRCKSLFIDVPCGDAWISRFACLSCR